DIAAFHRVREIVTLPEAGNVLCGVDLAILILTENVPPEVAQPLSPVTADVVATGLTFSAVGYGETSDTAKDPRGRRPGDGLRVRCVGGGCGTSQIAATEFAGDMGICPGDSGGPALDAQNAILGIASRSGPACSLSIFQELTPHLDFLRSSVNHAAQIGG